MGDNNDAFMEGFGDSLLGDEEGDPYQIKSSRNTAEALDTSLQAPNANDFSNARLIEEVRVRAKRRSVYKASVYSTRTTCCFSCYYPDAPRLCGSRRQDVLLAVVAAT